MKNSSKKVAKVSTKKVTIVFGKEIPQSWRNEFKITVDALEVLAPRSNVDFKEVLQEAIKIRVNSTYNLKPFKTTDKAKGLSSKSATNFENRISRILGGTLLSATGIKSLPLGEDKKVDVNALNKVLKEGTGSIQAKFFNYEVQTGKKIKFLKPIDPTAPISKQVKDNTINLANWKRTNVIKNKRAKFESLNAVELKQLTKVLSK